MKVLLSNQFFKSEIINLKVENFKNEIQNLNQKGEKVTDNQISNMSNIHQSLLIAKDCEDLIYFVEDDYLHQHDAIEEMIFSYEKFSTIYKKDIIPNIDRLNYLKIPTSKVDLFYQLRDSLFTESNSDSARHYPLDKLKSKSSTSGGFVNIVYTVRSGDVLIRIADLYDCSVSQIRRWNNIRGDYLRIDQRLIIKKPSSQQAYYRRINKMTKAQKNNIIRKD